MIYWKIGVVIKIETERKHIQFIQVKVTDGEITKGIHYTDALPSVEVGDEVLLNTTAVDLELGSGGYHFVYMILDRQDMKNKKKNDQQTNDPNDSGHIMKFRYTPQQRVVFTCEEPDSPTHKLFVEKKDLANTPVLIGELHSMLPVLCCWIQYIQSQKSMQDLNIVYVMSEGGALPISFSEHVNTLKNLKWIEGTITYGHTYGGDVEAVNKFSALIAAKHIFSADIIIVLMGPGIVGTGTKLGHTGIEVGEIVNAVSILCGFPIIVPRLSFQENRTRHRGISHHLLTTLSTISLKQAVLPFPHHLPQKNRDLIRKQLNEHQLHQLHTITWNKNLSLDEVEKSLALYPFSITTMGRELQDDPSFFLGVCSAAQVALDHVNLD